MPSWLLGISLGVGLPILAIHMMAIAISRALRTYSRSRLEAVCTARGRPNRADEITRRADRTEDAADAVSALTGLALAALLGAVAVRTSNELANETVIAISLLTAAACHLAAGIAGRVHAERILDRFWLLARAFRWTMSPVTAFVRGLEATVYQRSRSASAAARPPSLEVELPSQVDLANENLDADLPESTRAILERAVEMAHRSVSDIMTPRSSILTLPASVTATDAARSFIESRYSRIPLYGEHSDDIVGILYAKDLFPRIFEAKQPRDVTPRKLARPTYFVPETKNAAELLEELRRNRVQIAVVLDEFGAVAGLVALEDLLEEVVGPIDDEHDEPAATDSIVRLDDSRFEVDAGVPLEELNQQLNLNLPREEDVQTVGGFVFSSLGHLPEAGETFTSHGLSFRVTEVGGHSIRRLEIGTRPGHHVQSPDAGLTGDH